MNVRVSGRSLQAEYAVNLCDIGCRVRQRAQEVLGRDFRINRKELGREFNGPLEVRLLRYEIPEDGKPPEIKLQPSRPRSKRPFAGGAASGQGQRSGPPFRGGPSRRR